MVAGFAFLDMEAETPREWAFLVLAGAAALLVVGAACWALAVSVDRLAERGVWGSSALYGVLVAIFVAGLEGLLFTLLPGWGRSCSPCCRSPSWMARG